MENTTVVKTKTTTDLIFEYLDSVPPAMALEMKPRVLLQMPQFKDLDPNAMGEYVRRYKKRVLGLTVVKTREFKNTTDKIQQINEKQQNTTVVSQNTTVKATAPKKKSPPRPRVIPVVNPPELQEVEQITPDSPKEEEDDFELNEDVLIAEYSKILKGIGHDETEQRIKAVTLGMNLLDKKKALTQAKNEVLDLPKVNVKELLGDIASIGKDAKNLEVPKKGRKKKMPDPAQDPIEPSDSELPPEMGAGMIDPPNESDSAGDLI